MAGTFAGGLHERCRHVEYLEACRVNIEGGMIAALKASKDDLLTAKLDAYAKFAEEDVHQEWECIIMPIIPLRNRDA